MLPRTRSICTVALTILLAFGFSPTAFAQSLELYPNVHTIGVNIDWPVALDPERDDTILVTYKAAGGHPTRAMEVSRVRGSGRVSTCIFNTTPATQYKVDVEIRPKGDGLTRTLSDSIVTRSFGARIKPTRTYYVEPGGDSLEFDSLHPGDLLTAMILGKRGEEIVLLGGIYEASDLRITPSNGPSIIRAAKGQHVTLTGGDHSTHTWTQTNTPGLYVTDISEKSANVNCVITGDGRRLYPYAKLDDLKSHSLSCILGTPQPCGLDGFWRDPRPSTVIPFQLNNPDYRKLYVKFVDNTPPLNAYLVISQENRGLTLRNASNIRIEGIRFKYYGVSPYGCALAIENSSDIEIDSCTFEFNDRHVAIEGSSHRISILNTTFFDGADWDTYIGKATYEPITPALCYGLIVPSLYPNNDRMMETGGIIFGWNFNGRGTIIKNCSFHGMMDGLKGAAPAVVDSLTAETDIYECRISGSDDAIEFDGNTANVRMWNTHVRDGSVSMAPSLSGPLYVFRNTLTDFNMSHATIEGYDTLVAFRGSPFKFSTGDNTPAGSVYVMHNTYVARGDGEGTGFELRVPAYHSSVTLLNNIFVAGTGMAWAYIAPSDLPPESSLALRADYNSYYTESADFGTRRSTNSTQIFSDLEALRAALPYEQHSMQYLPVFANQSANDFRPAASSRVIDAGVVIPGINEGKFEGLAPDIGAFEFTGVSAVESEEQLHSLVVYPNPARDLISVSGNAESGTIQWSIIDLTGRTVLSGSSLALNVVFTIDISMLPAGIYTLATHQSTGSHTVRVGKL